MHAASTNRRRALAIQLALTVLALLAAAEWLTVGHPTWWLLEVPAAWVVGAVVASIVDAVAEWFLRRHLRVYEAGARAAARIIWSTHVHIVEGSRVA